MEVRYDPYDHVESDPYPVYARLRQHAPVYHNAEHGFWALSRYEDVRSALRDPRQFSNAEGISIEPKAVGSDAYRLVSVVAMDPPDHTRLRRAVAGFFTRTGVAPLESRIRARAVNWLSAALDEDRFDFIADYAAKLPMDVLCALVGVPDADSEAVRHLAELLVLRTEQDRDLPRRAIGAIVELQHYYRALVAERRRSRCDDLISALLDAPEGDIRSDEEIVALCFLLTTAGNDAPAQLLGNAWYWAWRNPDQRNLAFSGRVTDWIDETLRFDTPTQILGRKVATDLKLSDTVIPAGDRVLLLLGSANHDPDVFPNPERYDLDRDTTQLLSFGNGPHFCLGQKLLLLIARVALEEVVARVADYDIHEAGIRPEIKADSRGFKALPTTIKRRCSA